MNLKGFSFFCIFFVLIIPGCNKDVKWDDKKIQPDCYLISFDSLTAEKDTISRGQSTEITAKVTGNKIIFIWSASEGPVLGEGSRVTYLSSPCCWGNVIITCEARAKNASESKSIKITVIK
ncbi:MAG TPA: hypothetical protein DDW27_05490 [Bacteroidales bacterium]|nr:hypothetical protein [Bacteroidales bacterium]